MASAIDRPCLDDELAARFASGAATPVEIADIESHLDGCATCRRTVAALAAGAAPVLHSFVHPDHLDTEPVEALSETTAPDAGARIGRYVTLGTLGRGGMGVVVAAHDPELDRRIAIKLVHPALWRTASEKARELLRAEARAMARLVHPNVVTVHDLGTVGDQLFVAMELVEGTSLDAWRRAAPRTWREVLAVCIQAGRGIAAAHRAGLVHRDVKPQNVLVDRHGHARITDFGLAALIHVGPVVAEAGPAGTPAYMSPEQHRCDEVGPPSDQFNFCVMLYEALFGERPFAGATPSAVALEVLAGRMRDLPRRPHLPLRVRRALRRGLATDPAARFPDMEALLAELAVAPRWRRFVIVPVAAAAAIAGALVAGGSTPDPDETARRRAQQEVAAVWNDARRAAIADGLAATGVGHAGATAEVVAGELGRYAARWIEARVEVAARNRSGRDPVEIAARRDACLARKLDEVAAVADVLAAADRTAADHALDTTAGLTPIDVCLDAIAPDDLAPEEPARRARYHDLHALLQHAVARDRAGQEAAADLEAIVAAARELDHPPLTAEALLRLGNIHAERRMPDADRLLSEAIEEAVRGGAARIAALAWIERVEDAAQRGLVEVARERAFAAEIEVARVGGDALRITLHQARAFEAEMAGRREESLEHAREATALAIASSSGDPLALARSLRSLGSAFAELHRYNEALPVFHAALALAEGVLEPDHPELSHFLTGLVRVHDDLSRGETARAFAERALALAPPDDYTVRLAFAAVIAATEPQRAEALSLQVADAADTMPLDRFSALLNLGVLQYGRLDFTAAAATIDRLLELGESFYDPRLAHATALRGVIALMLDDRRAEAWCRRADELVISRFGRDDPERVLPLACVSQALRLVGRAEEARAPIAEALRVADLGPSANDQINARVEMTHVLWSTGDKAGARRRIAEAIELAAPGPHRDHLLDVQRRYR
jgi:tetratricopeptide (TPR) repeat protein